MKQVQRDSKYIIKRILIGVGIAILLANLKKCNVYADEIKTFCPNNNNFQTENCNSNNIIYGEDFNITYNNNLPNATSNNITFQLYNSSLNAYLYYFVYESSSFNYSNLKNIGIKQEENNLNDSKLYMGAYSLLPFEEVDWSYTSPRTYDLFRNHNSFALVSTDEELINSYYDNTSNFIGYYKSSFVSNNKTFYVYFSNGNFYDKENFFDNYDYKNYITTIVNTPTISPDYENFYKIDLQNNVSDTELNTSPIIPQGFSEIDITNYDGVYFVPKNYNNIQIETVDNINFIDFNYYYKGNIKDGFFPLEYPTKMVSDYKERSSPNEVSYVDSIFPMYENSNNDPPGYQYYSYFIYNSNKGSDTKIYYNSVIYNYFIIEDMYSYKNENVCTIGRNDEELCFTVDFQSYLDNYWLEGFAEGGDDFTDDGFAGGRNKIDAYLDLLKIPFNFLRSLNRDSCSPINLPIPYVGGNIQINCLSDIFKRTLGNFYYILFYIVSAFYIYFITIKNIDTFTDILNPDDDKLEVVDL